jgi:hypothetical protein
MSIPEYKSKRNRTWENQSLTLQAFAAKLNPYLGGTYKNIGDSGAATTINWSAAKVQELNLNADPTLTLTNGIEGSELTLLLASGTTQRRVTWPSDVTWSQNSQPTITPASLGGTFVTKPVAAPMMPSGFNGEVQFTKVLSTGKILASGQFNSYNGVFVGKLVRLNPDLTIDPTWTLLTWSSGTGPVRDAIELPNGNIVIVGDFQNNALQFLYGNNALQLLTPNGDRINTPEIFNTSQPLYTIGIQSNGKFIVGGNFTVPAYPTIRSIARIEADLSALDSTFQAQAFGSVRSLVIKADDTVYLGGDFTTLNGIPVPNTGLGALTANGLPVAYFQPVIFPGPNSVNKLLLTDTGQLYVAGNFYTPTQNGIIRFTSVGGYDSTFTGYGTTGTVNDIAVTADGTVVVIGMFSSYNFVSAAGMVVLNPDGTTNTNFLPTANAFNMGTPVVIDTLLNGNLVIAGSFTGYQQDYSIPNIVVITGGPQDAAYTKVTFQYNGDKYIGSF